jgi:hypothetical protein
MRRNRPSMLNREDGPIPYLDTSKKFGDAMPNSLCLI